MSLCLCACICLVALSARLNNPAREEGKGRREWEERMVAVGRRRRTGGGGGGRGVGKTCMTSLYLHVRGGLGKGFGGKGQA